MDTAHFVRTGYDMMIGFLSRDAFVRTNSRAIARMFVGRSVCLPGAGVHCDHTVHWRVFQFMVG